MTMRSGYHYCYRIGCTNPVVPRIDEINSCGRHGGETKIVWAIYRDGEGWLSDNDTIVDWVQDVDEARWFDSDEDAVSFLVDYELVPIRDHAAVCDAGFFILRLK